MQNLLIAEWFMSQHRNVIFSAEEKRDQMNETWELGSIMHQCKFASVSIGSIASRAPWAQQCSVYMSHGFFPNSPSCFAFDSSMRKQPETVNKMCLSVVPRFQSTVGVRFGIPTFFFEWNENPKRQPKKHRKQLWNILSRSFCRIDARSTLSQVRDQIVSGAFSFATWWRQSAISPSADTILVRRVVVNCWLVHRLLLPSSIACEFVIDAFHFICTRTCSLGLTTLTRHRKGAKSVWFRFVSLHKSSEWCLAHNSLDSFRPDQKKKKKHK